VTTVKIHLTLVHPSQTACVVPLHFVSDLSMTGNLSSTGVAAQHHVGNSNTTWNPNEGRHVLGLVNTCAETVTLDLATSVSPSWALHSQQAVRSTISNQEFVDISDLLAANHDVSAFATHGLAQCLKGIEIPGLSSFILAQHIKVKDDAAIPGSYGAPSTPWEHSGFQYGAYDSHPLSSCASLGLSLDVDANEGNASIPITQVSYNGPSAPGPEYPPAD
jgi:hypothetical protein